MAFKEQEMIRTHIHKEIMKNISSLHSWFDEEKLRNPFPFYASFDIRDSGEKIVPVDANLFPGGFNNTCKEDKENAPPLIKDHFKKIEGKRVALFCEDHAKTSFYWDNVGTLIELLERSGLNACALAPQSVERIIAFKSYSGKPIRLYPYKIKGTKLVGDGGVFDIVISNNDFMTPVKKLEEVSMTPPYSFGWHHRKKDAFFQRYNRKVEEFCDLISLDASFMKIKTKSFEPFQLNDSESMEKLAESASTFLKELKVEYKNSQITSSPYLIVKDLSGTYGMGILPIKSGQDLLSLNRKQKNRMKVGKGKHTITGILLQEGVKSSLKEGGLISEPVIYTIGGHVMGGFLRAHSKKGPEDSLNSPGAVYKKLCMSDLNISETENPIENIYGWIARIGLLSLAEELGAT